VFAQTTFSNAADIIIINNHVIVHRVSAEGTNFYVVGSDTEVFYILPPSKISDSLILKLTFAFLQNELILSAVLDGGYEAISSLLRDQLDQRSLLDNLELVLLALDELIDTGVILEMDPIAIKSRVLMMDANASGSEALGEMTISEAFEKAKAQAKSGGWLSGWGRSASTEEG
jgi:hypothetical protein